MEYFGSGTDPRPGAVRPRGDDRWLVELSHGASDPRAGAWPQDAPREAILPYPDAAPGHSTRIAPRAGKSLGRMALSWIAPLAAGCGAWLLAGEAVQDFGAGKTVETVCAVQQRNHRVGTALKILLPGIERSCSTKDEGEVAPEEAKTKINGGQR